MFRATLRPRAVEGEALVVSLEQALVDAALLGDQAAPGALLGYLHVGAGVVHGLCSDIGAEPLSEGVRSQSRILALAELELLRPPQRGRRLAVLRVNIQALALFEEVAFGLVSGRPSPLVPQVIPLRADERSRDLQRTQSIAAVGTLQPRVFISFQAGARCLLFHRSGYAAHLHAQIIRGAFLVEEHLAAGLLREINGHIDAGHRLRERGVPRLVELLDRGKCLQPRWTLSWRTCRAWVCWQGQVGLIGRYWVGSVSLSSCFRFLLSSRFRFLL